MAVTPVAPAPAEPAPTPDRGIRSVAYLVAAAILVVGVVGLVLLFGVHRPPPLDDIAPGASPEPPAAVAWTGWTGSRSCLSVIQPDGSMTELTCDREGLDVVAWIDDGIVVHNRRSGSSRSLELIDPETGRTLESWLAGDENAVYQALGYFDDPALDTTLYSRYRDGVLTVSASDGTQLWRVEAPEVYRVQRGLRSPDGSVVAAIDSGGRLLVLDATGSSEPRVWRDGLDEWSLFVWEGQPLPAEIEPTS
jgi:hypothetical protein